MLVAGVLLWILPIRLAMPIEKAIRIETPGGPIDFRLVVIDSNQVYIRTPPHHTFYDIFVPDGEADRIRRQVREGDPIGIALPGGASLTLRPNDDGAWDGFWTAPPNARIAPYLPASVVDAMTAEPMSDPDSVDRLVGNWLIVAADGSSGTLELRAIRDNWYILGLCTTFAGEFELAGYASKEEVRLVYFDGEQATAVHGQMNEDGTLSGDWWDSQRGLVAWTGTKID